MMRTFDGIRLAQAKLRTHRVRTGIVLLVVSLLFAGIGLGLFMLTGAVRSMKSFDSEGLGNRYIVQAVPIIDGLMQWNHPDIRNELAAKTTQLKAEKKDTAKKLGIVYDPATDNSLPMVSQPGTSDTFVNNGSPYTTETINRYVNNLPHIGYEDFKGLAEKGGAIKFYKSTAPFDMMRGGPQGMQNGSVVPIVNGKEDTNQNKASSMSSPQGFATMTSLGWSQFDSELLYPFILPGQTLVVGKDGSLPVIAPYSAAEEVLKLDRLPATSTAQQKLDRLVQVRKEAAGKTAQLCYRNNTSMELLEQAKNQAREIASNAGKKDYIAPALQYNLPTEACGAVTVKKDTRTAEEKKQTANELTFKRQYEGYKDPEQSIITMRIIGIVPDMNNSYSFSIRTILESVLQSRLGQGWFSPISTIASGSPAGQISKPYEESTAQGRAYYAEFPTMEAARQFAKDASCSEKVDYSAMTADKPDPRVVACYAAGKYFDIRPFGNNASAIADVRQNAWKVLRYVVPAVLLVSSLVLMGIVGKIIADSRRETAVFRALGATRGAIAQIYFTYSLFIAGIMAVLSLGLGAAAAYLISQRLTPDASVTAVLAYNAADVHKQFTFFGIDARVCLLVGGLIVVASLLSTIGPLLSNVRRNPIRDMRDEN